MPVTDGLFTQQQVPSSNAANKNMSTAKHRCFGLVALTHIQQDKSLQFKAVLVKQGIVAVILVAVTPAGLKWKTQLKTREIENTNNIELVLQYINKCGALGGVCRCRRRSSMQN